MVEPGWSISFFSHGLPTETKASRRQAVALPVPLPPSTEAAATPTTLSNKTISMLQEAADFIFISHDEAHEATAEHTQKNHKKLTPTENAITAGHIGREYAAWAAEVAEGGLKMLHGILPSDLSEWDFPMQDLLDNCTEVVALSNLYLNAIDCGLDAIALGYERTVLYKTEKILKELNNFLTSLDDTAQTDAIKRIKKIADEMQIQLDHDKEDFIDQCAKLGIKASSGAVSFLDHYFAWVPSADILSKIPQFGSALSSAASVLGLAASGFSLKHAIKNQRIFNKWNKSYNKFLQKHHRAAYKSSATKLEPQIVDGYKKSLISFIENSSWKQIQEKFADYSSYFSLPKEIDSKKKLMEFTHTTRFRKKIVIPYAHACRDAEGNTSTREAEKRLLEQKLFRKQQVEELLPLFDSKRQEIFIANRGEDFEALAETDEGKRELLHRYLDYQHTIENTVKTSLKDIISSKLKLEGGHVKLKTAEQSTLFTLAAVSTILTIAFAIIGITTLPVGGLGGVFLGLSVVTALTSCAFFAADTAYEYRKAPRLFTIEQKSKVMMTFHTMRLHFEQFRLLKDQLKLIELAARPLPADDKGREKVDKQRDRVEKSIMKHADKTEKLIGKIKKAQDKLKEAGWEDFASHADLKVAESDPSTSHEAFDSLNTLLFALIALDIDLLDNESKHLLEVVLGLNLKELKADLIQDPLGVKDKIQKGLVYSKKRYIHFIRQQQKMMEKGILPSG